MVFIPDLRGGGAEKVTVNLCNELVNYLQIEIVVMNDNGVMQKNLNDKIKIYNCKIKKLRSFFFIIPKIIKTSKPDYILGQMWPLTSILIIAKYLFFLKGKFFICEHINIIQSIKNETGFNYILSFPIIFLSHNLCDKLIVVSKGVKNQFTSYFKINSSKIKVIYNPVIDKKFKNFKVTEHKIWNKKTDIKMLSIGRLKKQKNYNYLINSLSLIKNINYELIIVGEGEEKDNISKLIKKLKLENNIKLIGYKEIVNNYYFNSDIFILPSLWEGFGNVIVEALYYNKKVISTDCKFGPREILLDNKFGSLVPINNISKFAETIIKVIKNKNKNTRSRALDFDAETISSQYLNLFSS